MQPSRLEATEVQRDPEHLLRKLRDELDDGRSITGIQPLSTGHSNETYLLEGIDLVLRLPPSGAPLVPTAHDMKTQHALYEAVATSGCGVPVPRMRGLHEDPELLGAPFYLMERLHGESFSEYEPSPWLLDADDDFRRSVSRAWFDAVLATHEMSPLALLGAPVSNADELERWHVLAREAQNTELLRHFDTLASTLPDPTGPPTVVHGDSKPANTLWQNGKLIAFLDWEMAFNGDPAWDLGYVLVHLAGDAHPAFTDCDHQGMLGRDDLLAMWEDRTGRSSADHLWFEAASMAKIASLLAYGLHLAESGQSRDERMKAWAPYVELFVSQTAAVLAQSTGRLAVD